MGIYLICRIIKLILDKLINGYALHTVYGWSVHLLGAMWNSLAQLLIFKGKTPVQPQHESTQLTDKNTHRSDTPPTNNLTTITPQNLPQPTRRYLYPSLNGDLGMAEVPLKRGEV
ncbi:hypothetical protein WH47_10536 [Habropoda laboriosa]|uniref:Uncharacterized protein n=1 Tax=Habropoda laboriosa TaxID=597456 RepID=A0A0L7QMR6_9HYME|nr:hypothetical protein WH47_10536 [Habropoda laboriosa]